MLTPFELRHKYIQSTRATLAGARGINEKYRKNFLCLMNRPEQPAETQRHDFPKSETTMPKQIGAIDSVSECPRIILDYVSLIKKGGPPIFVFACFFHSCLSIALTAHITTHTMRLNKGRAILKELVLSARPDSTVFYCTNHNPED